MELQAIQVIIFFMTFLKKYAIFRPTREEMLDLLSQNEGKEVQEQSREEEGDNVPIKYNLIYLIMTRLITN